MQFKRIMRYDPTTKKARVARVIWDRGEPGKGGYSAFLSLTLVPKWFAFQRVTHHADLRIVVLGVGIHYRRSYGGRFV